jgi:ParB/Sulfiredoxin domain
MALIKPSQIKRLALTPTHSVQALRSAEETEPRRTDRPSELALKAIHVAPDAFQWRDLNANQAADTAHMQELIRVLQETETELDPVLVTAVGRRFFLIDGHHRLDAYYTVKWSRPIAVEHFEGSLEDAQKESLRRNNKNKLAMTVEDKREAAWKLLQEGKMRRKAIEEVTTVSPRTIATMAKVLREHKEAASMPWRKARQLQGGKLTDLPDDWLELKAQKWAKQWVKNMPRDFSKKADVMARAIELLDPALPRQLISEWPEQARELAADQEGDDGGSEFAI